MEAVTRAVQDDEEILNRTSLEKEDIIHLTRLCLESTFFQYNNKIYKQIYRYSNGLTHIGSHSRDCYAEIRIGYL